MDIARLITSSVRSDRREFDRLMSECHRQAYNVAFRMTGNRADAEDLTQESFLRAFRFFDRYDRNMPFENWLYRIMSRVFIDELRKRPRFKTQSLDQPLYPDSDSSLYLEIPDFASNPEQMTLSAQLDERLQQALNSLPEEFRIAVILADIEGIYYEEIYDAMACTVGPVRSRLHRGRKALRARLNVKPAVHQ